MTIGVAVLSLDEDGGVQVPSPSHVSPVVVSSPSSQGVVAGNGILLHCPVVGMQLLASRQSVADGQLMPAHLDGWMQEPLPSHRSNVVPSASSVHEVPADTGSPRHVPLGPKHEGAVKQSVASLWQVTVAHAFADHADGGPV